VLSKLLNTSRAALGGARRRLMPYRREEMNLLKKLRGA